MRAWDEMMAALQADGAKLRAITGQDHGPAYMDDNEDAGLIAGTHYIDADGSVKTKPDQNGNGTSGRTPEI